MTCLIFPSFDPDRQLVGGAVLASPLPTSVVPAASAASVRQAKAIPARAPALLLPFTSSPPSGGVGYVLVRLPRTTRDSAPSAAALRVRAVARWWRPGLRGPGRRLARRRRSPRRRHVLVQ